LRDSRKIIVDSGVLIAIIDSSDKWHLDCLNALKKLPEITEYVTSESCIAEATYILPNSKFVKKLEHIIQSLPLTTIALVPKDLARVFALMEKYQDQPMDFADACVVALAERLGITTVFTIDRRDFSIYKPNHATRFRVIP